MLKRVTLVLLLAVASSYGQHVLYNQGQDKTAQDAQTAAKEITSGAIFNTMLHNLDVQAKHEADTTVSFTREQMRSKIASARLWNRVTEDRDPLKHTGCSSVRCSLERISIGIKRTIPNEPLSEAEVQHLLDAIRNKAEDLEAQTKGLQQTEQAKNEPDIIRALDHLGDAKDLVGFAEQLSQLGKLNQGTTNALNTISSGLDELLALYGSFKAIWSASAQVTIKIGDLAPRPETLQLQLLALEEQHLKKLTEIRAKRALHAGDALASLGLAENILKTTTLENQRLWDSNATIDDTLYAAIHNPAALQCLDKSGVPGSCPNALRQVIGALYLFAAVAAAEDTTTRMAAIRESDEERRYSIRKSAVNASTYDTTIQAAVQRLAVYYKSGIKPSDLAALIFYITNSVAVPTLAAK